MSICYSFLNGNFINTHDAKISTNDRAFLFSHGVYESIAIVDKSPFYVKEHISRLIHNLDQLLIPNPYTELEWITHIKQLIEKNNIQFAKCYIQVTGGAPDERLHHNNDKPQIIIQLYPWDPSKKMGTHAITVEDNRWGRCDIKSTSLLPNILAARKAHLSQCIEAIFINQNNHVLEGTSSNVFMVKNSVLITAPSSSNLLNGITRQIVIKIAKLNDIQVDESLHSLQDLYNADEVFTTSSYKHVHPITKIDNKPINNEITGKTTQFLRKKYLEVMNLHYEMV